MHLRDGILYKFRREKVPPSLTNIFRQVQIECAEVDSNPKKMHINQAHD